MSRWPGDAQEEHTTFGGLSRSDLMARVRSAGNETTETRLSSLLRRTRLAGWRRHMSLPGRPDFAWPSSKVAVFVDGCFWHGHDCGRNVTPKTNAKAWREKIARNRVRDRRVVRLLRRQGWATLRIWECQLARNANQCLRRIRRALDADKL